MRLYLNDKEASLIEKALERIPQESQDGKTAVKILVRIERCRELQRIKKTHPMRAGRQPAETT